LDEGNLIVWTPEMSVGVDVLDEDHKILIDCLNQFVEATDNDDGILVTDSIFSALLEYTDYHFRREEGIMLACGYAGLQAHKLLHAGLREKIIDIRQRYVLDSDGMMDDIVKDFLKTWLTDHILNCDMDYKAVVQGREDEFADLLKQ